MITVARTQMIRNMFIIVRVSVSIQEPLQSKGSDTENVPDCEINFPPFRQVSGIEVACFIPLYF